MAARKNPPDADSLSWGRALASRYFYRVTRLFQCIVGLRAAIPIAWSWNVKSVLNIHWKDWCWSWNSNTLAIWCEELTHWKRPWCWERLNAGREGDNRGWDGWMASLIQWTWVWAGSGSWWCTGKPGVLQSMGLQRVRHYWATELNWNPLCALKLSIFFTKYIFSHITLTSFKGLVMVYIFPWSSQK